MPTMDEHLESIKSLLSSQETLNDEIDQYSRTGNYWLLEHIEAAAEAVSRQAASLREMHR